jgi:hypothetical protein
VRKVIRETKVIKEIRAIRATVLLVQRALIVKLLAQRVIKVIRETLARKDRKEKKAHKARRVSKVRKELRVTKVKILHRTSRN